MLTLNDEQEKALRAWWLSVNKYGPRASGARHEELNHAIAPLMQPWSRKTGGSGYIIVGPDELAVTCGHGTNANGEAYGLAERICRLLNESEK